MPEETTSMGPDALKLELRLDTHPLLVSPARRFVEEALEKAVTDADFVSRVAMTAHELLENAAKYAHDGKADLSLTMPSRNGNGASGGGSGGGNRQLVLRLSNIASPLHLDRLRHMFAQLDSCGDPLIFYLDLMRRNAHETGNSGLGLARIRAEGEMALTLAVDGERATIVAHVSVPEGGAQ
jgi:hypothetical protein